MILNCFWWSYIVKHYIHIIICLTEPRPGEPLHSPSQAPQAWGKKKGPPQVMPPQAVPPPEVMPPQAVPPPEVMPPQAVPPPEVMPPQAVPPPEVLPPQAVPPPEVMPPQAVPPPEVMPPQAVPPSEVMPPQGIPRKTRDRGPPSGQPPPRLKGPGDQPQHVVEPAGTSPRLGGLKGPLPSQELSLVAPGGKGPRGATPRPPCQAPSSSHAPAGKITSNYGTFRLKFCQMFQPLFVLFLKILVISLELCMHKYSSKHCLFV